MTSKGAATSLIALSVLLFIASGNVFGALVVDNNVMHHVNYNRGDYALIAETKIKADQFPRRIAGELNYTSDDAALTLASNHGDYSQAPDISWDNNVPSEDRLMENYYSKIQDSFSDENDEVLRCEGPEVTDISKASGGSTTDLEALLSHNWIKCTTERSEANISMPSERVEANNVNNRYPGISTYASVVAGEARGKAEEASPITGTGDDDGNSCPEDEEEELNEAKSNARSNALAGYNLMGEDALEDTSDQRPEWLEANSTTIFDGTVTGNTSSYSCTYGCDELSDGTLVNCNSGTAYDADAEYEADQVVFEYSFADEERKVVDSDGNMKTIDFDFIYKHSFN